MFVKEMGYISKKEAFNEFVVALNVLDVDEEIKQQAIQLYKK